MTNHVNILGVKVDEVNEVQAIELISEWLKNKEKKYIVTPNIEFVMHAQNDSDFKKIINNADLAIPDSARFNWALTELSTNPLKRLLLWPFFFFPQSPFLQKFPVLPGTDLMETLIKEASKKGWTIGLLGGKEDVAEKLKQKLQKKYPELKVTYAEPGGVVDEKGDVLWINQLSVVSSQLSDSSQPVISQSDQQTDKQKTDQPNSENRQPKTGNLIAIPPTDLLFVAFGHGKQEKWIAKNLQAQPVKLMMGVGGAFDYLSGEVSRAPKNWRKYGFEWLYRLIQQPWRAKRFLSLIYFTILVLFAKSDQR